MAPALRMTRFEIEQKGADHKALGLWASQCAGNVLRLFEQQHPDDPRPRQAIDTLKTWIRTGEFSMAVIRHASLDAHAAARTAGVGTAACFAARAAGQAVATAHVASHSIGAAWYGAKAADAAGLLVEREWQRNHLPKRLLPYILNLSQQKPGLEKVLRYSAAGGSTPVQTAPD
jgi:hypothetical protein